MNATTRNSLFTLSAAAVFSILVLGGCYTLLKHPRVESEPAAVSQEHPAAAPVRPQANCIDCHAAPYASTNEYLPYRRYYGDRETRWLHFYETPWWANPDIYVTAEEESQEELPSPRQLGNRRFGRNQAVAGEAASAQPAGAQATPAQGAAKATRTTNAASSDEKDETAASNPENGKREKAKGEKPASDSKRRVKKKKDN